MRTRRIRTAHLAVALLIGLTAAGLDGCGVMDLFHQEVQDPPAPTTVPLPTPITTTEPAPSTVEGPTLPPTTAQPTPTLPHTSTPPPETPPTRVVPPPDPVQLPPGFGISVFADGLRGPRMMTVGPEGALYVAERGAGRILRLPDRDNDGVADGVEVVAEGLDAPSSIQFHQDGDDSPLLYLYVGETTRVLRLSDPDGDGIFQEQHVVIEGLPSGGHSTRTLLFGPDGEHLYVSIGSSCNVCIEEDERRATIMRYNPDGSGGEVYAQGLRNAVGITFRPGAPERGNELWATNNGRDWLGDDQPPETIYVVEQGDDAGWPRCHSGRIVDPDFGAEGACEGVLAPVIEMQAHSAPLGLTFYTGQQFPDEYQGDLFVAFHGSWNRSEPTGYKVVRVPMEAGTPGSVQDFAVGWLRADGSNWGRPVDVTTGAEGSLFLSDDGEGRIYRLFYAGDAEHE